MSSAATWRRPQFFSLKGRLKRYPYAVSTALLLTLKILAELSSQWLVDNYHLTIQTEQTDEKTVALVVFMLLSAVNISIIAAVLCLTVRRLHDLGLSGWFALLMLLHPLIFYIGCVALWCLPPQNHPNRFDLSHAKDEGTGADVESLEELEYVAELQALDGVMPEDLDEEHSEAQSNTALKTPVIEPVQARLPEPQESEGLSMEEQQDLAEAGELAALDGTAAADEKVTAPGAELSDKNTGA